MPMLSGGEIGKRWSIIKSALKLSAMPLADTNEKKLKNILKALLTGRAACWMTGNERRPRTLIVFTIVVEEISETKSMLIYCAHGFEKESAKQYEDILVGLKEYAVRVGCENIISYIADDKLKEVLQEYGAECNYTLCIYPLSKNLT